MGEGKEHLFGFVSSGSSITSSSVSGNPGISRGGFKAAEGPASEFDFRSDDVLSSYDYSNKQSFSDGHLLTPAQSSNCSTEGFMTGSLPDRLLVEQLQFSTWAKRLSTEIGKWFYNRQYDDGCVIKRLVGL